MHQVTNLCIHLCAKQSRNTLLKSVKNNNRNSEIFPWIRRWEFRWWNEILLRKFIPHTLKLCCTHPTKHKLTLLHLVCKKLKQADNCFLVQTFHISLSDHQQLNQNPFHQWVDASYFSYGLLSMYSMDAKEHDVSVTWALSPDLSLHWCWDPWHHLPTEWM